MTEHEHVTALPPFVHAAELETIHDRRIAAGLETEERVDRPLVASEHPHGDDCASDEDAAELGIPSTRRGLIGLSISGGGIRSSTFSLGVIQALARRKLFKRFDYISTVSGGGYTGSMLSSLLRDPMEPDTPFPLDKPKGREEPPALRHLRNGSNYLSPGGLLNTLRLPAVVIRGLLLNTLLLLPLAMIAVSMTEFLHEEQFLFVEAATRGITLVYQFVTPDATARPLLEGTIRVMLALFLIVVWYHALRRAELGPWAERNKAERFFASLLLLIVLSIIAIPTEYLIGRAMLEPYHDLRDYVVKYRLVGAWILAAVVAAGAVLIHKGSKPEARITKKLLLVCAGIMGPLSAFGVFLLLLVAQVDSPFLMERHGELMAPDTTQAQTTVIAVSPDDPASDSVTVRIVPGVVTASPALLAELRKKGLDYVAAAPSLNADSTVQIPAQFCQGAWHLVLPGSGIALPDPRTCTEPAQAVEEISAGQLIRIEPMAAGSKYSYEVWGARLHIGGPKGSQTLLADWIFLGLAFVFLIFNRVFLDVNISSLNRFYRDRLSRLYIFRAPSGKVEGNDEQKLHDLNREGSVAPYHIINATLNLQGDQVESTRGRSSDFFMFSKHFTGGPHTGYCRTKDLEDIDPQLNLGTAMAISAAAAAPNMGSATTKSMVFVLTMLNVRLAYWLPNPAWVRGGRKVFPRWTYRPGTMRLIDEALGNLTSRKSMVNVSDGGHLENLATYELLRRRCKMIVLIDGEADPDLTFHGLVTLIRYAKIDLGVSIRVKDEDLRWLQWPTTPPASGTMDAHAALDHKVSKQHFVVAEIDYGADGKGCLVYVKSTVTGDENAYIDKYRQDNPDFPHQTTADQFFDETQFEAYRALGYHVGHEVGAVVGEMDDFLATQIARFEAKPVTTEDATVA